MTRWMRDFRLMPIVLIAVGCLFALKSFGLLFNGGYTLGQRLGNGQLVVTTVPTAPVTQLRSPAVPLEMPSAPPAKLSWMQEMFNYPSDVTGTIKTTKPAEKAAMEKADAAKQVPKEPPPGTKDPYSTVVPTEPPPVASAGERALLERLQKRREELDARGRELDLRESLLKAAEKKLETGQPSSKSAAKGGAEGGGAAGQGRDEGENARFKSVVTIYETMKPKDAAKIFDRLDIKVLLEMASQIKPQIMSAIMAQMTPEAAERLTIELAAKSGADRTLNPMNLPKIEGRTGS
jgi:flagellar motility protein MotE (MotC chaperone)